MERITVSTINKGIGERLKEMRKQKGMTQRELAERLQISRTQIQRYERGEYISVRLMHQVAEFFGMDAEMVFSEMPNNREIFAEMMSHISACEEHLSVMSEMIKKTKSFI